MAVVSGTRSILDGLELSLDSNNNKSSAKVPTVRVLVVGGGGGGGMDMGGGGGGGGVVYEKTQPIYGDVIVTVGRGGYGAPAGSGGYRTDGVGPQPGGHQFTIPATAGLSSSFGDLVALGGGFGGSSYRGYTPGIAGGNGGSGGGASGYNDNAGTFYGGAGTVGQGFRGGNSTQAYYSGGGGGAGGPGADSTNQPNGGPGVYNDITGTGYYWGGGGGGSAYSSSTGGNGGIGGGGGGAIGTTTGGAGYNNGNAGGGGSPNSWAQSPGGNGGANTGGGGGGGSHYNANNKGGEGGSGIVVVRYPGPQKASGGNIITTVSGDTVHIFTSSGVFSPTGFTNTKSANTNLLGWDNWVTGGTGSVSGYSSYPNYSQNGSTDENVRVTDTGPWGNPGQVVWETRANGSAQDDGGWNTGTFSVDRTKLYRYSVWMRRTSSSSGGTFYFGMYAGPSAVLRNDNSTSEGNPYWECKGTGNYTQNQWYLIVGHVYPNQTAATTTHPDTGVWTISGGKVASVNSCNIGQDLKWNSDTTYGQHRTYHYYCGDNTTRLQLYQPRVDLCDGSEPTIAELLANDEFAWYDLSMNAYRAYMTNMTRSNYTTTGVTFDAVNDYVTVTPSSPFNLYCLELWLYNNNVVPNNDTAIGGNAAGYQQAVTFNNSYYGISLGAWTGGATNEAVQIYTYDAVSGYKMTYNRDAVPVGWHNWTFNWNGNTYDIWIDGVKTTTYAHSQGHAGLTGITTLIIGRSLSQPYYFNGQIAVVKCYSSNLTDAEVLQNFNTLRGRYGI
jgi:hypothetical protein